MQYNDTIQGNALMAQNNPKQAFVARNFQQKRKLSLQSEIKNKTSKINCHRLSQ